MATTFLAISSRVEAQQTLAGAYSDMANHSASPVRGTQPPAIVPLAPYRPEPTARPTSWPSNPVPPKQWDGRLPAPSAISPGGYPTQGVSYPPPGMPSPNPGYPPAGGYPPPQPPYQPPYQAQVPPEFRAEPIRRLPLQQPPPQQPPEPVVEPCETAQIVAWVGPEVILAGELLVALDLQMEGSRSKLPAAQFEAQREQARKLVLLGIHELLAGELVGDDLTQGQNERRFFLSKLLTQQIQTKLVYHDAQRTIPEEGFPSVEKNLNQHFEKALLPKKLEAEGVSSRNELDAKLRAEGLSLQRVKRALVEQAFAQMWYSQQLDFGREITHDEMVAYYHEHRAEFEHPGRARWEELAVRFSEFPNEAAAYAAISRMGNQVFNRVPLAEVAKAASQGTTADDGGIRDWTTQDSLVSETLDRAVFGLPVGQLSPILRTENGLHIIRVVQREDAGRTPFVEAQVVIRPEIKKERREKGLRKYLDRLYDEIPVRTARGLEDALPKGTERR